jgi:hypothetical protein
MYSQLLSINYTWRWGPWISLIYNGVTGLGLLFTYFPHAHVRAEGFSAKAIINALILSEGPSLLLGLLSSWLLFKMVAILIPGRAFILYAPC